MVSTVDHLASRPGWACCATAAARPTPRSRRTRCWRSPRRTCAAWAATCSPSCTSRDDGAAGDAQRRGSRRARRRRRDRLRAEGHDDDAVPARHPLGDRCPAAWTVGWRCTSASAALPLAGVLAPAIGYADDGFPAVAAARRVGVGPARRAGRRRPARADGDAHDRRHDPPTRRRPCPRRRSSPTGEPASTRASSARACSRSATASTPRRTSRRRAQTWVDADPRRGLGPRRVERSRRTRRATSSCRARGSPTGSPCPTTPAIPLWAHLLVEASQAGRSSTAPRCCTTAPTATRCCRPRGSTPRRRAIDPDARVERGHARGGAARPCTLCAVDGDGHRGLAHPVERLRLREPPLRAGHRHHPPQPRPRLLLEPGHPAEYGPAAGRPTRSPRRLVTSLDGTLAAVLGTMGGDSPAAGPAAASRTDLSQRRVAGPRDLGGSVSPRRQGADHRLRHLDRPRGDGGRRRGQRAPRVVGRPRCAGSRGDDDRTLRPRLRARPSDRCRRRPPGRCLRPPRSLGSLFWLLTGLPSRRVGILLIGATTADGATVDVRIDGDRIAAVGHLERLPTDQVQDLAGFLLLPARPSPTPTSTRRSPPIGCPTHRRPARRHRRHGKPAAVAHRTRTSSTGPDAPRCPAWRNGDHRDPDARRSEQRHRAARHGGPRRGRETSWPTSSTSRSSRSSRCPPPDSLGRSTGPCCARRLAMGADIVGGCPHLDDDRTGCLDACLEVAAEPERPIDLHTDETLDPEVLGLRDFAPAGRRRPGSPTAPPPATASASACRTSTRSTRVAAEVAEAGRRGRDPAADQPVPAGPCTRSATPRGLTAIRPLLDAGVTVAAGADNLQDPFNTMGRADPLETAALLVMVGHLLPDEALRSGEHERTGGDGPRAGRRSRPAPRPSCSPCGPRTLREAIATARPDRLVFHRGRLVAADVCRRRRSATGAADTERSHD